MSLTMQSQIAKSREQALAAFVSKKAEIDEMLTRLQALSDDHFNYSPDEITWGHVVPLATTRSCSSASPTAPSTRASTPSRHRSPAPAPRGQPPPGLRVVGGRWCSPKTEIIP
jgi:hypothetical protein